MNRGLIISGAGHLGLIVWVLLGDWLFMPSDAPVIQAANVSVISSAEFDAMQSEAPAAPLAVPDQPAPPDPAEAAPEPAAAEAPAEAATPAPDAPAPEAQPDAPPDVPISGAPQPEAAPEPTAPLATEDQPIPVPNSDQAPAPRPIDRVAAEPVDPVQDAAEVADAPTPPQTDQPAPETPPTPAVPDAAPEAAAPQVVTEATDTAPDAPQLAPTSSRRPQTRPKAPAPGATPAPEAATEDAVAAAIAAAVADAPAPSEQTSDTGGNGQAEAGPPMTQGEKDALRVAVSKCWNLGAVSTEAMNTVITVSVSLSENGTPDFSSIRMTDFTGGSQSAANTMLEAARSAIFRCGRDGFSLPLDKYDQWKDLELVFDPRGMSMR